MKRGKEISLKLPYQYNVVSGTVDNKNPKSIYIQISAWGKPKGETDEEDYERIIKQKSKRVKRKLFDALKKDGRFYKDKCIVDFNMASSGVSSDKRSFMSVELTLFQKKPFSQVNSDEIFPSLNNISSEIIEGVFEKDEDFKFYSRKS
tara:strand:- start:137 stop:580 length:444 start_codon:yes stop_codon:yes gene_type:complete